MIGDIFMIQLTYFIAKIWQNLDFILWGALYLKRLGCPSLAQKVCKLFFYFHKVVIFVKMFLKMENFTISNSPWFWFICIARKVLFCSNYSRLFFLLGNFCFPKRKLNFCIKWWWLSHKGNVKKNHSCLDFSEHFLQSHIFSLTKNIVAYNFSWIDSRLRRFTLFEVGLKKSFTIFLVIIFILLNTYQDFFIG